jgi:hypothetical protein
MTTYPFPGLGNHFGEEYKKEGKYQEKEDGGGSIGGRHGNRCDL